jgi:TrmH family RNA methyltransferase
MNPSRFQFVMVETLQGGNVGSACRALKNNGFTKSLRLVNPPRLDGEATKMAWKSLDVLRAAKRFDSVDAAIADCRFVAAFSSRDRRSDRPFVDLDSALPSLLESAARPRAKVALLFGREDRGLTREELASAQVVVRIDAARQRQVYNLAQAMLLVAYRLRRGLEAPPAPAAPIEVAARTGLTQAARRHLREKLRSALLALGYGEMKDRSLLDRIVARGDRLLDRAGLEEPDLAMLLGVIRRIEGSRARGRGKSEK